jgi:hypothetical protein
MSSATGRASSRIANRDIRVWARANGYNLTDKGPISAEVRDAYAMREESELDSRDLESRDLENDASALLDGPTPGPTPVPTAPTAVPTLGPTPGEVAPVEPGKRRWRPKVNTSGPRRRESLETLATGVWGAVAMLSARSKRLPTARVLELQAPVAGIVVDDVLRGTLADRLLQPLARTGKRGETVLALVGPVVLVELIQRRPDMAPQLIPLLALALESWVDIAGPKLLAAQKRRQKRIDEIGESGIEDMINALFAPPPGGQEASSGARAA